MSREDADKMTTTSPTSAGSITVGKMEPDFSTYQPNTENETLKILGATSYTGNDAETSLQQKQYSANLAMYLSSNSLMKEMPLSYAHNTNISDQTPGSKIQVSGVQRKIVKSNNHYNISSYVRSPNTDHERKITMSNISNEMTEEKLRDTFQRTNSSLSLDFMAEGERMVSELCNISTESHITELAKMPELKAVNEQLCAACACNLNKISETIPSGASPRTDTGIYDESVPIQIIQLAVEACTVAENIAIANKNRPCFKNIQTICEKTRSNVQKPDSAVANLHSQGVPWVIKNFIFSFVRILDGWKGIKELLCEKHESFKRIETKYYNPHIRESFIEWQVATKNMLDHIYKTFKALDSGFQAEQQRYKQNASGINFAALQNQNQQQKQQMKQIPLVPVVPQVNQQKYMPAVSQWGNSTFTSAPLFMPQGAAACGNVYPQWNIHPQTTSSAASVQTPLNAQLPQNDTFDSTKRPVINAIEPPEKKDEKKVSGLVIQPNTDSWLHQQNKEFMLKYQPSSSSQVSCIGTFKKTPSEDSPVASDSWHLGHADNQNNQLHPMHNINYWTSKSTNTENKIPAGCFDNPGYNEFNIFTNKNSPNIFPQNQNTFVNSINTSCHFESENDVNELTKVYMKPGSYNVPIKQCDGLTSPPDPNFGALETMTVHNSLITKGSMPRVLNLPFPKTQVSPLPQPMFENNTLNLLKRTQSVEKFQNTNNTFVPTIGFNKMIPKMNDCFLPCSDKDWEAAKQLAPKLLTSMHVGSNNSKSNTQRLYDALETNQYDEIILRESQHTETTECVDSISWNKVSQEFFGGNIQSEMFKNNTMVDVSNKNIQNSENEKAGTGAFFRNNMCDIQNKSESPQSESLTSITSQTDETMNSENKSLAATSNEACFIQREYASNESTKKFKKKSNLSIKCSGRKKNEFSTNDIKKMESILVTLWNMDKKNSSEINKGPHFLEVTKHPMTYSIISDRLKSSYYGDVHQVANDIRSLFYNAYENLKMYPDEKRRSQVDEMCTYFEKLFSEEIVNVNTFRDKNRKQKKRIDFYDDKRINMFTRDSKKTTETDKCLT